ncbi:MAG: M15 family metallopeptidase [Mycobacteriaceae bacterium]
MVGAVTVQCASGPSVPAAAPTPQNSVELSRPSSTQPATVHPVTAAELGATWRPECPVEPESLRRIDIDFLGFDGVVHRGQLVVHEDVVDDVIAIVDQLRQIRYPIEKMQTVEKYPGAEDELSMQDNNTSAFNCRALPGSAAWSLHAYGRAIDINPLVNPYIDAAGDLQPSTAGRYLDRTRDDLGLLHAGDAAVRAFTDRGWRWGGNWRNPIDYQHFERD